MGRPTPNQKSVLLRLGRMSGGAPNMYPRPGRWIEDRDCGGPAALAHLYRKELVERRIDVGARGGEHAFYRPNADGWALIDKANDVRRSEHGLMTLAEIDTRLINARTAGIPVRVITKTGAEYRAVPGPVSRGEQGYVYIALGQRLVALADVSQVLA